MEIIIRVQKMKNFWIPWVDLFPLYSRGSEFFTATVSVPYPTVSVPYRTAPCPYRARTVFFPFYLPYRFLLRSRPLPYRFLV